MFTLFLCISKVLGEVIYAVNCGGDEFIDSNGIIWSQDKDFEGGLAVFHNDRGFIRFTHDPYLYMSERQFFDDFTYMLPRLNPGKYVIILKFAEYFNNKGRRMFNIAIGSQVIFSNMDIYEGLKDSAAIDEFISVSVTEKGLYWNGLHLPDAFKADKLLLKFLKTGQDYPKVSGIMIVTGTLEDTYYNDHKSKVLHFKQLVKNKQELSEKPLQFPKDHQILTPVTAASVISKFPLTIVFCTLTLYIVFSYVITPKKR